ncbi:late endosome to vacuole transport-related protein [Coprinopsis sp. MPI-PUGE-AT-0042]|nr:late endosome to vacuole transport-related protein [Coprinopsis sp. MPI-PUGE-AT-0042]
MLALLRVLVAWLWTLWVPVNPSNSTRTAISALRAQIELLNKKQDHLEKRINDEISKAQANVSSNKAVTTAALQRKKMYEIELNRLNGSRLQLETQVHTLESADLNAETVHAMKQATRALKGIHGKITIDTADAVMADVQDQTNLAREIAEVISAPVDSFGLGTDKELENELLELQAEALSERLSTSGHVLEAATSADSTEEQSDKIEAKELRAPLA